MTLLRRVVTFGAGYLALASAWLLTVLAAAVVGSRKERPPADARVAVGRRRFCILVPAHDEEAGIAQTVTALRSLRYPADRYDVVVAADHCRDATVARARAAGARVLPRDGVAPRGKGATLEWALPQVLDASPRPDAVVVIDADCTASPNLLEVVDARMGQGALAVQVDDVVANPDASPVAALRYAAFALRTTVRCLGKGALGASSGLHGTGMAFERELLVRRPWRSAGATEDHEHHLRLIAAGERVVFAGEAAVASSMRTTLRASRDQDVRWDGGRARLTTWALPRLVTGAISRRDHAPLITATEMLVPPQSVLATAAVVLGCAAGPARAHAARRLAAAALAGQAVYVLGGLALVGAPRCVYRSLLHAPAFAVWKAGVYLSGARGAPS